MVDKVIGELPSISSLDAGSLFVAEQEGQAVKVSGKQLTDFSNVETTAQVEQAKASAQAAKTAQEAAEAAIIKSPIIQNGTWCVYNQTAGAYQDTGIEATGPQGIPGPTSSVNSISPDASGNITLTASNVNAYSKTETDTLLQNNDPRQWGLGKDGIPIVNKATLDGLFTPGWYMFYDPNNALDNGIRSGLVEVKGRNNSITSICVQEIWTDDFQYGGGLPYKAERKWNESAWSPLEWFNPPLILGVEYRTTERYQGRPLYTKLVDCGKMPSKTTKTVDVGVENLLHKVSVEAMMYYNVIDNWTLPLHNGSFDVDVWFNNQGINIRVQQSGLSAYTCYATIKYTKTTD